MIYMLGMSHLQPVLDAIRASGPEQPWGVNEPSFIDWDVKPDILPDRVKAASIYTAHTGPYWGTVLARQMGPSVVGMAPGFRKLLESIDGDHARTTLFVFMYGHEHLHMWQREHHAPHDFYLPWRPDLPLLPHRQVVPLDVIEREVEQYLEMAKANFMAIRATCPALRVISVVCPPPPGVDVKAEAPPEGQGRAALDDAPTRFKYYLLYAKALSKAVQALGIESMMPAPDTLDADGFLMEEYGLDTLHGNEKYGSRVAAQMNEILQAGAQ